MYSKEVNVKLKYLLAILSSVISASVYSASFTHKGEVVTSSVSSKIIDCGTYKVNLSHETFPFKYENYIPSKYRIKGFYGSVTTINKKAVILPSGVIVPNPNDLMELKALYPEGRTYLAGSAVCSANKLIVSYWSGGNCYQCDAFVSFDVSGSKLLNPKKATYNDFKAISQ